MASERYLIVNGDDFGQSLGVNRGVIAAHEQGILTSASLMVRWPTAVEAARYARQHPALSVGLHVDLGEWTYRDHTWVPIYEVVTTRDRAATATELSRQLSSFRRLVGRDPTHLDSHQHVHRDEPLRTLLRQTARSLRVPLRNSSDLVRYCGDFYGQTPEGDPLPGNIGIGRLLEIVAALPPGITELGCHPAANDDLETMYRQERLQELKTLCDPRARRALRRERVQPCSFHDVAQLQRSPPSTPNASGQQCDDAGRAGRPARPQGPPG